MADFCVTAGCGHLQQAQTVETPDTAEIIHIGDVLKAAKEKIGTHVREIEFKIHRFPANLRGFGTDRDYIAPWIVAIGPYYHGVPELQAMEEVKRMAAYYFCEGLADSPEEVYKMIFRVAFDVRGCYADADKLEGITDDDFAAMMFFDGCFLVQCMVSLFSGEQSPLRTVICSKDITSIMRDIMLLENQIPWPVLQLLTTLRAVPLGELIGSMIGTLDFRFRRAQFVIDENFKPPHLLGLIRFYQVHVGEIKKVPYWRKRIRNVFSEIRNRGHTQGMMLTTSAAELAEIGVKLTPSGTSKFSDMNVVKGPLFATLSLAPLFLYDLTFCWFVNMAAFEQCICTDGADVLHVNSYLCVVGQLINREDDVGELCRKRIVHTTFGYHQTFKYFKDLYPNLRAGLSYFRILRSLERYKHERWMWVAIYKFLYNNTKTIATVMSIIGVLVGIFKTLLSLKQHQQ